jgi:hypothetical protein
VSDQPLLVYVAAAPDGGEQRLVGVARADIDRVEAVLAHGVVHELALNEGRGFGYAAATADEAALSIVAYSGGNSVGAIRLPQTTTHATVADASTVPVYGLSRSSFATQSVMISRLNSRTLQPEGRGVQIVSAVVGLMALSPDGNRLAVASTDPPALMIVDLQSMRVARRLPLPAASQIRMLAWPAQDRLIELRQVMKGPYRRNVGSRTAVVVDPSTGARVAASRVTNKLAVHGSVSTPMGLVLLLGSSNWKSPNVELVLAGPDGGAKTVNLPFGFRKGVPGWSALAVDSSAGHAYIAGADGLIFDVDLGTMAATKHTITPPHAATVLPPPIGMLQAQMLGHDLVAAGVFASPNAPVAQGVALVDTQTWTTRILDAKASFFSVLGDRLVTFGRTTLRPSRQGVGPSRIVGHGLTLYDETGQRLAHLYGARGFQNVLLTPGYGHVIYNGKSTTVPTPGKRYARGRLYYTEPNDQLVFGIATGTELGGGTLTPREQRFGSPMPIFRGSPYVGESGDRLATATPRRVAATASTGGPTDARSAQRMRKLTGTALLAAIQRQYGHAVAVLPTEHATASAGTVGVWASATRTVFSEKSSVGVRFYVEIENGKIKDENVRGLTAVF